MNLTYDDVAQILRMIDQEGVRELRLEHEDFSLVVRKEATGSPTSSVAGPAPEPARPSSRPGAPVAPTSAPAAPPAAGSNSAPPGPAAAPSPTAVALVAPMPGTFYRAPAPGEPPFVNVGDHVSPADVTCILDVMKLMNRLNAPCAGTVVQIGPADGQAVSAQQSLVWIEPDR